MKEFESVLAKARKLASVANPANGAAQGEMENAAKALEALLKKHGITLESISAERRSMRGVKCISSFRKHRPSKDIDLSRLCAQCLRHVTGNSHQEMECCTGKITVESKASKRKIKFREVEIFVIYAEVTDLEYQEWCEAYLHYAGQLKDMMAALRKEVRLAQKAVKAGLEGFVNRHGIFAEDAQDSPEKEHTTESLEAFLRAFQSAKGETWIRKGGYLQEELFLP